MLSKRQIQKTLNYLGYGNLKVDGVIGFRSRISIKNFQKSNELTRDGIWGEKTNNKALRVVAEIQDKLHCKSIDGIVGSETIEKTRQFQLLTGLKVDGIAGVKTRAKLFNDSVYDWSDFPHFKQSEFACKDHCGFDNENLKVVKILEEIRAHFGGKPVIITSRM